MLVGVALALTGPAQERPTTRPATLDAATRARLQVARALFDAGDSSGAGREVDRLLEQKPDLPEALALAGLILLDGPRADPLQAARRFEAALAGNPDLADARLGMGLVSMASADPHSAIVHFDAILRSKPDHQLARFHRGRANWQLGKLDGASADFSMLPKSTEAREYLALIASRREMFAEAAEIIAAMRRDYPRSKEIGRWLYQEAAFRSASSKPETAAPLLEESLKQGFVRVEVLNELGRRAFEENDMAKAVALFRQAAGAPSIHDGSSGVGARATSHYNLGFLAYDAGNLEEARDHLRRAVELDPVHENAWHKLGQCLQRMKRRDEAKVAFDRHATIQPLIQSMKSAKRSLVNDPGDQKTRGELVRVLSALGRHDEAVDQLLILETQRGRNADSDRLLIDAARRAGNALLVERLERRGVSEDTGEN